MSFPDNPQEHEEFEVLCTGVEDYEPLPVITTRPDIAPRLGPDAQADSINDEILAGLVSP
jgi:hypothetical protein